MPGLSIEHAATRDHRGLEVAGVETSVETCSLVIVCVSDCVRVRSRDC